MPYDQLDDNRIFIEQSELDEIFKEDYKAIDQEIDMKKVLGLDDFELL